MTKYVVDISDLEKALKIVNQVKNRANYADYLDLDIASFYLKLHMLECEKEEINDKTT